ncbi:hypothetical protein ACFL2O_05330 [Thermodesulfobacteriota bacterium]
MRRFSIFTVWVSLCLCFAMPAMAKVHVGGLVTLDASYQRWDSDGALNQSAGEPRGSDDWQQLGIVVPDHTRLNGRWENVYMNLGLFLELGLGSSASGSFIYLRNAYGWYKINSMFKLIAGQTYGSFSTMNPAQFLVLGADWTPDSSAGDIEFANFEEDWLPQLRLETRFNDMITWKIAAVDNRAAHTFFGLAGNEENAWPRIDSMLSLKFDRVYVESGFSWSKGKRDEGGQNPGAETSFDVFAFVLGFKFRFDVGPFFLAGKGMYGRAFADRGAGLAAFIYSGFDVLGPEYFVRLSLEDSQDIAFGLKAGFRFGHHSSINLLYGYQNTEGVLTWFDGEDWQSAEQEWTRHVVGITAPIILARIFIITPRLLLYDWGNYELDEDLNVLMGLEDVKLGREIVGGVSFTVVF